MSKVIVPDTVESEPGSYCEGSKRQGSHVAGNATPEEKTQETSKLHALAKRNRHCLLSFLKFSRETAVLIQVEKGGGC
jgi:hypothetical protein